MLSDVEVISMIKEKVLFVSAFLFLFGNFFLWAGAQSSNKGSMVVTQEELNRLELEQAWEEATPILPNEMAPKLKKHSKLYKKYRFEKKLPERIQNKDIIKMERFSECEALTGSEPPFDLYRVLQEMSVSSSAIIVGTVENKTSQLTEDEDYVFTDYEISVVRVLKNNDADTIREHSKITFTRPGGTVILNGHLIWAVDDDYLPLKHGLTYLIFLQSIPGDPDSYQSLNKVSTFLLYDNRVYKMTQAKFPLPAVASVAVTSANESSDEDVNTFIDKVCAAIATSHANGNGAAE